MLGRAQNLKRDRPGSIPFLPTIYCASLGKSLVAQLVKNPPAMQEILVQFLGWEDPLEKEWARRPTSVLMGFSGSSEVKASACNAGDPGSTPGLGRSPGGGCGNPLQYSCLENPINGEAW